MNTVRKGNLFEKKAYKIITAAIEDSSLGLIPNCCRVFAKKAYFSRDRNSNIIFDLSIEVWPKGAERCHLLYLIEAKDYTGHSVPVDDIEEFVAKINQVVGIKAKGVFITTSKLQESALNYAKSKDLMVIYVNAKEQTKIILHSAKREKENLKVDTEPALSEDIDILKQVTLGLTNHLKSDKDWDIAIEGFLAQHLSANINWKQPGATSINLAKLSKGAIEEFASQILGEFALSVLTHGTEFPFNNFIAYIKERFKLSVVFDQPIPSYNGKTINGYCDFDTNTIYLEKSLYSTGLFLFTLAHELAHYLLHSNIWLSQKDYDEMPDSLFDKTIGRYLLINEKHWLEWQANQFAAALLMPFPAVMIRLVKWQTGQGIRNKGRVWVDNQPCNKLDFKKMLTILGAEFGVSRAILEYRMADLGIITYAETYSNWRSETPDKTIAPQTVSQLLSRCLNYNHSKDL